MKDQKRVNLPKWTEPIIVWGKPKVVEQLRKIKFDQKDQIGLAKDIEKQSKEVDKSQKIIELEDILKEYKNDEK